MLKGKTEIIYSIMKIAFYAVGCWEYNFSKEHPAKQIIFVCILLLNSFFRQFYIYKKENLYRYGRVSIILEFIFGAYIASLMPVGPVILLLTPTVFESMAFENLIFGTATSLSTLISLIAINIIVTLHYTWIYDYANFFRSVFISYGLGFLLVIVISYLGGLQFREREKIARANRELEQAYKKLLDNASKIQELSVEKERNRMAREIHDTLAHTLTTVVVQMEACKKLIDVDISRAKLEIDKAQELTRAGLGDVKRTIKALRPQILENCCLSDAICNLIKDIEESTHVKVNFNEGLLHELEFSSTAEVTLFRVIQESITNAIRHGSAKQIDISMTHGERMLNIDISDNGKGCAYINEGYGLKGIVERIKGLSGAVHFSSARDKGFRTQITIPYKGVVTNDD